MAFFRKLPGVLATIGGLSLAVLMVVTVSDIFGRSTGLYHPLGLIEISQLTLILVGFMSFPYMFMKDGQIIVDLFTHGLPARVNARIDLFTRPTRPAVSFTIWGNARPSSSGLPWC